VERNHEPLAGEDQVAIGESVGFDDRVNGHAIDLGNIP
jgi:hypothetical protein